MMYHHINILLREVVLYNDYQPHDFRPPFFVNNIDLRTSQLVCPPVDVVVACITSTQALLDVFISLETDKLRSMPVRNYMFVTYAAIVLSKLYLSTHNSASKLGKMIDPCSLKIDHYSSSVVAQLWKAAGSEKFKVPTKFLVILSRLDSWLKKVRRGGIDHTEDDSVRPLMNLSVEGECARSGSSTLPPKVRIPPTESTISIGTKPQNINITTVMTEPMIPAVLTGLNYPFYTSSPILELPFVPPQDATSDLQIQQNCISQDPEPELDFDFSMEFDSNMLNAFGVETKVPEPTSMESFNDWPMPPDALGQFHDESMAALFEWDPSQPSCGVYD